MDVEKREDKGINLKKRRNSPITSDKFQHPKILSSFKLRSISSFPQV
jgi:hypothetical protein